MYYQSKIFVVKENECEFKKVKNCVNNMKKKKMKLFFSCINHKISTNNRKVDENSVYRKMLLWKIKKICC